MRWLLVLVFVFVLLGIGLCQDPVVQLSQGRIRGIIRRDRGNNQFFSFRNIPYAAPPIDDLRFQDPHPPVNWLLDRDSSEDLPYCFQPTLSGTIGGEDCLYLNVHTRQIPPPNSATNQRPVMVWIHGGFFTSGSGREDFFNPDFLMTQNVVLVTMNYRLNIFGFFSVEDNTLGVPGNAGLKDQVMALTWVKNNIHHFGGNSSEVTIFGQGSGAVSVHFHVLSPLSRGLFHRAIMQSGTALGPWVSGLRNNGIGLAHELNVNVTNRVGMMETLRWFSTEQIFEGLRRLSVSSSLTWGSVAYPVIERQTDETAFLRDNPFDLIDRGQFNNVPLMFGYTDAEGITMDQLIRLLMNTDHITVDFTQMIPPDLNIPKGTNTERSVSGEIQNFYFPNQMNEPLNRTALIELFTDLWFAFPAFRTATIHTRTANSNIFFYRFSADTALNVFKRRNDITALIPGASHEDDTAYLFRTRLTPDVHPGSLEDFAITRMVALWTSFAAGSNVIDGFTWVPIRPAGNQVTLLVNYAEISTLTTTMDTNPNQARMAFWTRIYDRHFRRNNASFTQGFTLLIMTLTAFNILA